MNKYAEAVKKGGDFWRIYMEGELRSACVKSDIFADSALFDKMTMRSDSKFTRVNGSGYSDSMARRYGDYLDHCVLVRP